MKGTFKALAVAGTTAALLAGPLASSGDAHADDGGEAKVTICHAAGRAGTKHFNTITIGWSAVYGPGGHFNENGTPQAGHEDDYRGACEVETPETSVPETSVPETPVPETPVPETPVPETPVPETPVPETPVPETPGTPVSGTPEIVVETPEIVVEATTPVLASEAPVPTTAVATDSRTLPETGSTNTWLALSALTLCALGSVLWALSRRSAAAA